MFYDTVPEFFFGMKDPIYGHASSSLKTFRIDLFQESRAEMWSALGPILEKMEQGDDPDSPYPKCLRRNLASTSIVVEVERSGSGAIWLCNRLFFLTNSQPRLDMFF